MEPGDRHSSLTGTECPDPSMLEGLFQGALAGSQRAAIEAHIDACPSCTATLAELVRLFGSATWGPGAGGPGSSVGGSDPITVPSRARSSSGPNTVEFGRYRLGRRLGAGAMGMVFEAEDVELDRRVAIKILHTDPSANPEHTRARLMREARAMAQTNHPNLVAVYEVGRVDDQVFLAMEFVEGGTLSQWLRPGRAHADILATFVMAGRGLAAAHAAGLVHRDFKPDNTLIGADGRARVTDFGLALGAHGGADAGESGPTSDLRTSRSIMTMHGAIVGTPAYMAPEQWRGQPADARSDQFSFCVALYEALVGTRPFAGDNVAALANAVLDGTPRAVGRELPRWLGAALIRGLAQDPAARFPSMAELLAVLERDRAKPRRVLASVVGMAAVAAVVGGGLAWAASQRPDEAPASANPEPRASASAGEPGSPTPPPDACAAEREAGHGRWTRARREALEAKVTGFDDGPALAASLLPMLDGWIEGWTGEADRSCRASNPELREAERRCLATALARFDAMVLVASEHGEAELAGALLPAAHRLPELGRCHDPAWLSLSPKPPPAELAGKVALLERDLAGLDASLDLEQWTGARKLADDLFTASEALGHAPLLAEVQLAYGRLELMVGETDAAAEWLSAAAETGTVAAHEQVVGLAALGLVEARAGQLRLEDARRWAKISASLADQLDDPKLRARIMLAEAGALAAVAEHREALDRLLEADAAFSADADEQHPWRIELELVRASSALATAELEDAERAAERAERLALAGVGPAALLTARAKTQRARVALARAKTRTDPGEKSRAFAEAKRLATEASRIPGIARSRRHDLERGLTLGLLGDIALAAGDPTTALGHYADAETYLYAGAESALPWLWRGLAQLRQGSVASGFAQLEASSARHAEHWADDDLRWLEWLRAVGLAALEAGELERAREPLERALALADSELGFGPQSALCSADLGQLERAAGHPKQALTLLDDGYVGMVAGLGQHHPEVVALTLARADLAWELGQHEYAARLYGGVEDDLVAQRGAEHPASQRALARRSQP